MAGSVLEKISGEFLKKITKIFAEISAEIGKGYGGILVDIHQCICWGISGRFSKGAPEKTPADASGMNLSKKIKQFLKRLVKTKMY